MKLTTNPFTSDDLTLSWKDLLDLSIGREVYVGALLVRREGANRGGAWPVYNSPHTPSMKVLIEGFGQPREPTEHPAAAPCAVPPESPR